MKLDYIIDTNILILLFNNRLSSPIPNGSLGYSVITEIEVFSFPTLSMEEEDLIRYHLNFLTLINLEPEIIKKTIDLRRTHRIKTPDAIVVASAWYTQSILITNDQKLNKLNEIKTQSIELKI